LLITLLSFQFSQVLSGDQANRTENEDGNQRLVVPHLAYIKPPIIANHLLMDRQKYRYQDKHKSKRFR
jgi:hypothetical protein